MMHSRKILPTRKKSETSGFQILNFPEVDGLFWLLELPNEILLRILNLLTATEVLSLSRLSQRIFDLSYTLKKAHFLREPKVLSQDIEDYFSRSRPKFITEISFNYLYTAKPSTLCTVIKKCRHLNRLYVIECGIQFDMIHSILDICEEMEELTWSAINPRTNINFFQRHPPISLNSLRKLSIFLPYSDPESIAILAFFIFVCRSLRTIYLNCTDDFIVLPYDASTMNMFRCETPIVDQQITCSSYSAYEKCRKKGRELFEKLMYAHDHYKFFIEATADCNFRDPSELRRCGLGENVMQVINETSFVQLTSKLTHLSMLPTIPANTVKKLVFILEDNVIEMTNDVIPAIIKIGGEKLQSLTIQDVRVEHEEAPLSYESKSGFLSYGLKEILTACRCLTSLNITEFHFEIPFPFEALGNVGLESLTLTSCALVDLYCTNEDNVIINMVSNSKMMKHFTVFGCDFCKNGPNDHEMAGLKEWKNLQHLSLMHIPSFRTCSFLRAVTDFCTELKRVEIVQIGHPAVCHYTKQVSYLLKNARKLNFFRLNQKGFHPGDTYFWKCVSEAKKLEGICILNASEAIIDNHPVIKAIQELNCLSLFHYVSRRYRNSLYKLVQNSMENHGIENPRVEVRMLPNVNPNLPFQNTVLPGCKYLHFPNL